MQANIGLEKRKLGELAKGSVFIGQFEQRMSYAFVFSYQSGDTGVLVLEGSNAGQVMPPMSDTVLSFLDQPVITVSKGSAHWSPSRPVSCKVPLCLTDKGLHFSVNLGSQKIVINVETGEIADVPYRAHYVSEWALQIAGEKHPVVMRE